MTRPTMRSVAPAQSGTTIRQSPEALATNAAGLGREHAASPADLEKPVGHSLHQAQRHAIAGGELQRGQREPLGHRRIGTGVEANLLQERPTHRRLAEHQGIRPTQKGRQGRQPVAAHDPPRGHLAQSLCLTLQRVETFRG